MKMPDTIDRGYLIVSTAVLFLLLNYQVYAETYYVSNIGLDANTGISPLSSWQTLDKVNGFVFQPGDSVLFKRGDIWRGQLVPQSGDSIDCIYYGAYDSGNNPLFMGSADLSHGSDWIDKGSNIWSSAPATTAGGEYIQNPSFDTDAGNWNFYSEGSADVTGARDITDYTSSPASFKITCTANGDNLSDIQFNTQNLSIEYGKIYRLTFKAKCSSKFQFPGVYLMKESAPYSLYFSNTIIPPVIDTNWITYSVNFASAVTADDAMIDFFFGNSLPDNSVFFIDDISFKEVVLNSSIVADVGNIIFNNAASFGVKKWSLPDLQAQGDFWYDGDSVCVKLYSSINPGSFYSNIECALTKHIINEQDKQYIVYENLALKYGSGHGIGGGNTRNIIVRGCDISYIGGGGMYLSPYGNVRYGNGIEFWGNAQHNLVEQCRIREIYDAALTNQNSGSTAIQSDIVYRNNLIYNAEWSYEYWNRPAGSVTHNIFFTNNTCLYAGRTWAHDQRPDKRGRHVNFFQNDASISNFYILNNIFYKATSANLYALRYTDLDSLKLNYNCWYQTPGDTLIDMRWGSASINAYFMDQFADYQNDYQQDTNSIAANPLFADTVNGDYQLALNSPCIDSGTPDTAGIPVGQNDLPEHIRIQEGDGIAPSIIDIGCYEYEYILGGINQDNLCSPDINIYPVPSSTCITIEFDNPAKIKWIFMLFNSTGQQVIPSENTTNNKITLNTEKIPQGVYFFRLINENGQLFSNKIIIE